MYFTVRFRPEVIDCLSSAVRKAIVKEDEHKISEECRAQLHVEKLRQVCGETHKTQCDNLSSMRDIDPRLIYCSAFKF